MRRSGSSTPPKRHDFYKRCKEYGIRHRHTKPYTPKTNGQVERFNRTLKEATIKKYHYENKDIMEKHINDFLIAYNCAKKLSAIKRMTPAQFCITSYQENPKAFHKNPYHQIVGLNNYIRDASFASLMLSFNIFLSLKLCQSILGRDSL